MQRRSVLMGLGAVLALPTMSWAADPEPNPNGDPYEWILAVSNRVLNKIKASRALRQGDQAEIRRLVDDYMMPTVDFRMVTRMTVGPLWRQATKEQRQELQELFEALLIRVYSGGLDRIVDQRCELVPQRNRSIEDDMVVQTELKSANNPTIRMDYRIYRRGEGPWRIVDLNVEGVWMVENYRAQFASVLDEGGIPALIQQLKDKINAEAK